MMVCDSRPCSIALSTLHKLCVRTDLACRLPSSVSHAVFLDLIDHPKLLPLLSEVCGCGGLLDGVPAESPYHGVVRTGGMSGRVVPSEANEQGYLSWHRYARVGMFAVMLPTILVLQSDAKLTTSRGCMCTPEINRARTCGRSLTTDW
jgi:hypothetical protein